MVKVVGALLVGVALGVGIAAAEAQTTTTPTTTTEPEPPPLGPLELVEITQEPECGAAGVEPS